MVINRIWNYSFLLLNGYSIYGLCLTFWTNEFLGSYSNYKFILISCLCVGPFLFMNPFLAELIFQEAFNLRRTFQPKIIPRNQCWDSLKVEEKMDFKCCEFWIRKRDETNLNSDFLKKERNSQKTRDLPSIEDFSNKKENTRICWIKIWCIM